MLNGKQCPTANSCTGLYPNNHLAWTKSVLGQDFLAQTVSRCAQTPPDGQDKAYHQW